MSAYLDSLTRPATIRGANQPDGSGEVGGNSYPPYNDTAVRAEIVALRAIINALLKSSIPDSQAGYIKEKAAKYIGDAVSEGVPPDSEKAKQIRAEAHSIVEQMLKDGLPHG